MTICYYSTVRPVAVTVAMLLLIVFGVISLQRLSVRELPDIDVPTVSVRTDYEGASASVVETKITQLLEDAVAGIEGLVAIESESEDGRSRITLEFDVSRDIDAAANDVRDRVSRVSKELPDTADAPVMAKYDASGMPVIVVALSSSKMSRMGLTDYADRYLVDRFSVISGVANVGLWGSQEQAMRIWLDRKAMAARGITVDDVEATLLTENVEHPGGRIESLEREFTVRITRQCRTPEEFGALTIKRDASGDFVRLRDIAKIEVAPRLQRTNFTANGEPMVGIAVSKQSTANTLVISDGARKLVRELETNLPEGMSLGVMRDEALFVREAMKEVRGSLIIAAILVLFIIFVFLGSIRASLIPAVTVPVSITSAFIVLYAVGYSVNMLTLLALVLAIGMVVDDAIVVLENVHRRIEDGEPPMVAAARGANQVIFAVLATTVVLAAVFLPICLWEGKTGKLFAEFAVAMTAAVCFSSFVALTLSPMMCAQLLRPRAAESKLAAVVDRVMHVTEAVYAGLLARVASYKFVTACVFIAVCMVAVWEWRHMQGEYEPQEDRGVLIVRTSAPEGTGFYAMNAYMNQVARVLQPVRERGDAQNVMIMLPGFGRGAGAVNSGVGLVSLRLWSERKDTVMELVNELREPLAGIAGVRATSYLPSGLGTRGYPVQFVIGGPDYEQLVAWRDIVLAKAQNYPGLADVDYDYKETTPQLRVDVNRERANELGVSSRSIGVTLETMLGSRRVTTFVDRGQEYDVVLQADRESRATPSDLRNIYVKSITSGELVPLDNVVDVSERGESGSLNRYNRMRAITITANVAPEYSLSDALDYLERTVRSDLPEYAQIAYKGLSKDFKDASGSMLFIFLLAIVVSYLALAAQFESFVSPLVVMLTVPLGMVGAVSAMYLTGVTMNIYTQIGIIMLIGLGAKNGILIVEFANQLRDAGMPFEEALFRAARLRLRPVLMTAISTVFGAIPLLFATGAGSASRHSIGTVVVYGGMSACLLTLFVVPIGYLILARKERSPHELARRLAAESEAAPEITGN